MITAIKKFQGCFQLSLNIHQFSTKILFILSVLIINIYPNSFCAQLSSPSNPKVQEDTFRYATADVKYKEMKAKVKKHMKFILQWNNDLTNVFEDKQKTFIRNECPNVNCYVTQNRNFFGGDLKSFDAIVFNGPEVDELSNDLPSKRYYHQKYIFANEESPENCPTCNPVFDNFFNWTFTYRLDSDIPRPYLLVRDMNNNIVGPKQDMEWKYHGGGLLDDELESIWKRKTKAAAWIVSHCNTVNKREVYAKKLFFKMLSANLDLDVFGACGPNNCSKQENCWENLRNDYFFYLSLENSNSIDYVTEKLFNPLNNYIIPIVFGGADYSRFLPPNSYLDARNMSVEQMVSRIKEIINSKELFLEYHRWRSYYYYELADGDNICRLCSALHDENRMSTRTLHKEFRSWWNVDVLLCTGKTGNVRYSKTKKGNTVKTEVFENLKLNRCSEKSNLFRKMLCEMSIMMHGAFQSFVKS